MKKDLVWFWGLKEMFLIWKTEICFGMARIFAIAVFALFVLYLVLLAPIFLSSDLSRGMFFVTVFFALETWLASYFIALGQLILRMPSDEYLILRSNPWSHSITPFYKKEGRM